MKITKSADDEFQLTVTIDQMLILNNALNEVCNGIEVVEFETRLGASFGNVESMLGQIGSAIDASR